MKEKILKLISKVVKILRIVKDLIVKVLNLIDKLDPKKDEDKKDE